MADGTGNQDLAGGALYVAPDFVLVFVTEVAGSRKSMQNSGAKALHRELEQVDGTYALRESGEAYRGQIDSKNEALRPENILHGRELPKLGQLSMVRP